MPMSEQFNQNGKEVLPSRIRPSMYALMRHGQPTRQGVTFADLSIVGEKQVENSANKLADELLSWQEKGVDLYLHYSIGEHGMHRPRIDQSMEVLANTLLSRRDLYHTTIHTPEPDPALDTTKPLNAIYDRITDYRSVTDEWINYPLAELEKIGAQTPGQIAEQLFERLHWLEQEAVRLGPDGKVQFHIGMTHESSLAAIIYSMNGGNYYKDQYNQYTPNGNDLFINEVEAPGDMGYASYCLFILGQPNGTQLPKWAFYNTEYNNNSPQRRSIRQTLQDFLRSR
jgi:hypothetical protein